MKQNVGFKENNEKDTQRPKVASMEENKSFKEKKSSGLEKDILISNKFLKEEQEFLELCGLNAQNFKKARWSWLENEMGLNLIMVKKYFAYVLLPYFIIKNEIDDFWKEYLKSRREQ